MIGSLVNFLYNDGNPDNLCVILQKYMEDYHESGLSYGEEDFFLIYDFKTKDYFYALLNELSFVYPQENLWMNNGFFI